MAKYLIHGENKNKLGVWITKSKFKLIKELTIKELNRVEKYYRNVIPKTTSHDQHIIASIGLLHSEIKLRA